MGAIALSTAGIKIKWVCETTAGTRPTSGYTAFTGFREIPDLSMESNLIDATPLDETNIVQYIKGLIDLGGALPFTVNLTSDFITAWEACRSAYATAAADNKATWFEVAIPNMKSFYFAGEPLELGLDGQSVGAVLSTSAKIIPRKMGGFDTASTTTP